MECAIEMENFAFTQQAQTPNEDPHNDNNEKVGQRKEAILGRVEGQLHQEDLNQPTPNEHLTAKEVEDLSDAIQDAECSICAMVRSSEHYLCPNGHSVCRCCHNQLLRLNCPFCRVRYRYPLPRDTLLEAKIKQLVKDKTIRNCKSCDICFENNKEKSEQHEVDCPGSSVWMSRKTRLNIRFWMLWLFFMVSVLTLCFLYAMLVALMRQKPGESLGSIFS